MLDSVVKVKQKYNTFEKSLEECKNEIKTTKMETFVNNELEASSSNDEVHDSNESDNEPDNESSNKIDKESDNE